MGNIISGIQQIGVGVEDFKEAWNWYIRHFYMNIRIFEEEAVAELMLPHTEGEKRKRVACLAINMEGGGGFEVWQHTGKKPTPPKMPVKAGELGINFGKMKCRDIHKAHEALKSKGVDIVAGINDNPAGEKHFYVKDPYQNIFEFVENPAAFSHKNPSGGTFGGVIGVKNMDESLKVYQHILEYDKIVFDETGSFGDMQGLPGGREEFRRVLLRHSQPKKGAFSPLLGPTEIELLEVKSREPAGVFDGRIWGDPGFIHLCFDIQDMGKMRERCEKAGFPFTVDSQNDNPTFDMGEAAGSFSYIQAPEGTLIEFVETHKVPVIKKLNWYIDLTKRKPEKPLPGWMLKAMGMNKVDSV